MAATQTINSTTKGASHKPLHLRTQLPTRVLIGGAPRNSGRMRFDPVGPELKQGGECAESRRDGNQQPKDNSSFVLGHRKGESKAALGRDRGCGEEGSACIGWADRTARMFPQEISRTTESSAEVLRRVNSPTTKCPSFPSSLPLPGRNAHQCSLKQEVTRDLRLSPVCSEG